MQLYLKRGIIFILVLFTFSLSISSTVYAQQVKITATDLLVRSGAGSEYEVIGSVDSGERYPLISEQAEWVEIAYNSTTGWVSKQYLTIIESNNQSSEEVQDNIQDEQISEPLTIKYNNTNIRSLPSTAGDILAIVPKGETVTQIDIVNGWAKVNWNDTTGYLPAWILEEGTFMDNNTISVLQNKVIVIDPGHGGRDVGAIGASGNFEKDYTLKTAKNLQNYLELLGATVYLTRPDDHYYTLTGRSSFSNYFDADVFLSLHYNSTPEYPSAQGINTYYYDESDKTLAKLIHDELLDSTLTRDRGFDDGDFQVIRTNHQPALLLELGFISNIEEENNIKSFTYQRKISQGIITGLQKYFSISE
ncbi:N-acetylmuramoyl-L-alanine amidase [Paraliobacillus quinghaiensis]|uniref:N-acetylmuramoyl-L-alanine amidase n=1 Tax=Paraliobacillus quinghaiensis TaxID=470815 RepID=A0A917WUU5_9BACI|nr:N-acetylmuramoyl-L-alanine amidase [Paraliobacillus quinghaiensis]GGM30833.1 N-acetylmuramoyl-L-alanine amidase [Paraliobacillus quinghaiensis]